jgi:hypothetical protein
MQAVQGTHTTMHLRIRLITVTANPERVRMIREKMNSD